MQKISNKNTLKNILQVVVLVILFRIFSYKEYPSTGEFLSAALGVAATWIGLFGIMWIMWRLMSGSWTAPGKSAQNTLSDTEYEQKTAERRKEISEKMYKILFIIFSVGIAIQAFFFILGLLKI